MQKRISNLPFHDTPEQAQKLDAVIESLKGTQGAVMPALHQAQDIYGYLPIEVQEKIAKGLGVSLEEVYGVSTFYSQFALTPKGRNHISVCLGTACYHHPEAGHPARGMYRGRRLLPDGLPLHRRLRPGPCHDRERRGLRPPCPRGRGLHPGAVHGLTNGHARALSQCDGHCPELHFRRSLPHHHPGPSPSRWRTMARACPPKPSKRSSTPFTPPAPPAAWAWGCPCLKWRRR